MKYSCKKYNCKCKKQKEVDINYKGLVLFDIDGTLTTGKNNEQVVQTCIDNGWAVGICTAGSVYTMDNLKNYDWMPTNLYDFIKNHENVTFNNVASGVLMGKKQLSDYEKLMKVIPEYTNIFGYRKGFALTETGKHLGIENPRKLILCDDLTMFIEGALTYNPYIITICSGENCGGNLTVENVYNALNLE